jgi:hypothetical protein
VSTSFAPVAGSAGQAALKLASQRRAAAARIEAARVRRCQIDQRLEQIRLRLRQLADASPAGPTQALPVAQTAAARAEHSARQDGAAFMWLELADDRLATAFDAVLDLWQVREEQLARCERLNWHASYGSHGWKPPR